MSTESVAQQLQDTWPKTPNSYAGKSTKEIEGELNRDANPTAALLEDCRRWVSGYLVITREQAIVLAAWILHSWAIDAADATGYLDIHAPEKGCGKSRLLEVLATVVREPCLTGGTTAAALVRIMDVKQPTLLSDEADAAFGGNKEFAEDLRGIYNNGYTRGKPYLKVEGKKFELREFKVFGAKAIAGIGRLPDTIASRSIPIEMKRKARGEDVMPFRQSEVALVAAPLREALDAWAVDATIDALKATRPKVPPELTDRQADITDPLFAIADMAGGEWPSALRRAIVSIFKSASADDESIGVQLLVDIRMLFTTEKKDSIASSVLTEKLNDMEGHPWPEWDHGKGLTPSKLARQLRKYNISPGQFRDGTGKLRGYESAQFADPWKRYCPYPPETGGQSEASGTTRINTDDSAVFDPVQNPICTGTPKECPGAPKECPGTNAICTVLKSGSSPHEQRIVPAVPVSPPSTGTREQSGLFEGEI